MPVHENGAAPIRDREGNHWEEEPPDRDFPKVSVRKIPNALILYEFQSTCCRSLFAASRPLHGHGNGRMLRVLQSQVLQRIVNDLKCQEATLLQRINLVLFAHAEAGTKEPINRRTVQGGLLNADNQLPNACLRLIDSVLPVTA